MKSTTANALRRDAVDSILSKISPADATRAERIRHLLASGDLRERELALLLLIDVLVDFPT